MNIKIKRAQIIGAFILFVAHAFWWLSLAAHDFAWLPLAFLWVAPFVVSLIVANATQGNRLLPIALTTAFASAILSCALNAIHQWFGNASDFSGYKGALTLFGVMFVFNLVTSIGGAFCGKFISNSRRRQGP
jgi:uncharacterized membrane protein YoaK (UPF0700 family)